MKNSGINRRIDDLGRIVIPRDIRDHFRVKSGDTFEIFIEDENIKERVKTILRKLEINLNTNEDSESLIKYIRNDKKALADKVTIVSVKEIGKYQFKELSFDDIESLLKKEV